jgi:hypothetical protein
VEVVFEFDVGLHFPLSPDIFPPKGGVRCHQKALDSAPSNVVLILPFVTVYVLLKFVDRVSPGNSFRKTTDMTSSFQCF